MPEYFRVQLKDVKSKTTVGVVDPETMTLLKNEDATDGAGNPLPPEYPASKTETNQGSK